MLKNTQNYDSDYMSSWKPTWFNRTTLLQWIKKCEFLTFMKWFDSLNTSLIHQDVSWLTMRLLSGRPCTSSMTKLLKPNQRTVDTCYSMWIFTDKLFIASKSHKTWTSSLLTVCISAIKMAVYTAINPKLESRGKIVGGDGKKPDRKPLARWLFNRKQRYGIPS